MQQSVTKTVIVTCDTEPEWSWTLLWSCHKIRWQ